MQAGKIAVSIFFALAMAVGAQLGRNIFQVGLEFADGGIVDGQRVAQEGFAIGDSIALGQAAFAR